MPLDRATAMESRHRMPLDFMADLLKLPQAQIVLQMCEERLFVPAQSIEKLCQLPVPGLSMV